MYAAATVFAPDRRPVSSYYDEARNVKMGESRSMNGIDATVRNVRMSHSKQLGALFFF